MKKVNDIPTHDSDYLVIGSGIAGLTFALLAAEKGTVTLITKKEEADSNTNRAQGGIACVLDPDDTFEAHIKDTLIAGAGLCNEKAVEILVRRGPDMIRQLVNWGVPFDKGTDGETFDMGREGGHSARRILHATDLTGREVEQALIEQAVKLPQIKVFEHQVALDLIIDETGSSARCIGAEVLDKKSGKILIYRARAVILSTGGLCQIYLHTTNPSIATGDGVAMAHRAGARIANMEFIQFHPTAFYSPSAKTFLISEAVRGEGAILKTLDKKPFMENYDERGCLAPRDIVARAIDNEMKKRGEPHVWLDITHKDADFLRKRFPNITKLCSDQNVDITKDMIPVVPAAHYSCGGVLTNTDGESNIHGLFATGEVACTGVHGANRLASNSLLEALVWSKSVWEWLQTHDYPFPANEDINTKWVGNAKLDEIFEAVRISHCRGELCRLMWDYVGIVRSTERLKLAQRRIELLEKEVEDYLNAGNLSPELIELYNMIQVSHLIVRSGLLRKESRGLHYIIDYPKTDDLNWKHDTYIIKPRTHK